MNISRKSRSGNRGFTLMEVVVTAGLSVVALGVILSAFIAGSLNFASTGNYIDLNRKSLWALDQITRDIRQAASLQTFATNQLVFLDDSSNLLTYAWSSNTRKLTRTSGGTTQVLLNDCDYLAFDISQRNPNTDGTFGFFPATNNPSICKLISVSWRCARSVLGKTMNTENVQTAKIVMRN